MGSQGATFAESVRMVVKSGGSWKRPVNRMYTYNFQIGENYYLPMTSYLETKTGASSDVPGPLCFSERISLHPLSGCLSMIGRSGLVDRSSLVDRGGVSVSLLGLWGVDRGALIGHLSNKSIVVISSVGGGLDSAIRKSNGERASNLALSILGLGLLEVSLGVVIGDSILIGEWLRGKLRLLLVSRGWVVWGGSTIGWGTSSSGHSEDSRGNKELVHDVSVGERLPM